MSEQVIEEMERPVAGHKLQMFNAERLALNAALQKKKNTLRQKLADMGTLERKGKNSYDGYSYFSESQYKRLFTELLSAVGLELSFTEISVTEVQGTQKQPFGRRISLLFTLTDIDTGYGEETVISGEAFDKGDKAGYKAYTGAYKYYLANTFGVATGDDPEKPDPEVEEPEPKKKQEQEPKEPQKTEDPNKISVKQLNFLRKYYKGNKLNQLLAANKVETLEDLPRAKADELCTRLFEIGNSKSKGEQTHG